MIGRHQSCSRFEVLSLFLPGWLWPGPSWSESGPTRSQAAAFSSLRPRPPLWPLVIFVSAVDFPPRRDKCGITGTCHEDKECTQFHRSHFVDWAWIHILRQSCVPCDDKVDGKERKRESGLEWFCVFELTFCKAFSFSSSLWLAFISFSWVWSRSFSSCCIFFWSSLTSSSAFYLKAIA